MTEELGVSLRWYLGLRWTKFFLVGGKEATEQVPPGIPPCWSDCAELNSQAGEGRGEAEGPRGHWRSNTVT